MRVALKFISIGLILCAAGVLSLIVQTLSGVKDAIDTFRADYGEDFLNFSDEESLMLYYIVLVFGLLLLTTICLLILRTTVERVQTGEEKKFDIEDEQVVGETDEERATKAEAYAQTHLVFAEITDHKVLAEKVLAKLAADFEAVAGTMYRATSGTSGMTVVAAYAHVVEDEQKTVAVGEGLIGQVAQEGKTMLIDDIPENYIQVFSGLGSAHPTAIAILPLARHGVSKGVIELAFFKAPDKGEIAKLEAATKLIETIFAGKAVAKED